MQNLSLPSAVRASNIQSEIHYILLILKKCWRDWLKYICSQIQVIIKKYSEDELKINRQKVIFWQIRTKKTDWSDVERTKKKLYSYSRDWRIIKIFLPNRTKDSNNVELWAIWLETYLPQGHRLCQTWVHHQSRCSIHWPAFQ